MTFILRITVCILDVYIKRKVFARLFLLNILHFPKIPFIFAPLNERLKNDFSLKSIRL